MMQDRVETSSDTKDDIEQTLNAFESIREKLQNGTYKKLSERIKV